MPRNLPPSSIFKLTKGDYASLMDYINHDTELALEIRVNSVAMVYYKKSKILSIHPKKAHPVILDKGYWKNSKEPILDVNAPESYFNIAKELVNEHAQKKKNREFDYQQRILTNNSSTKNPYLVIDMEYQFAQDAITKRTKKNTRFDLVAVNLQTKKIILIELKHGFGAMDGSSGADDHYQKFKEHNNHPNFKKALVEDVNNILDIKKKLGILPEDSPSNVDVNTEVQFAFAFSYSNQREKDRFKKRFANQFKVFYIDISKSQYLLK